MLFDLRSKRRRHLVRIVYGLLALIMLGGLVLVGVGTGNNNGGILNAFTNNGSGGNQNSVVNQQVKAAVKKTEKDPNSGAAWANLVQARWTAAGTGSNYDSTTSAYTDSGKDQLRYATAAWTKYLSVTNDKPAVGTSFVAAHAYQALTKWSEASQVWQYVIDSEGPGTTAALKGYLCTALTSYAAGQKSTAVLAQNEALKVASKTEKLELKSDFSAAKASKATAAQYAAGDC